MATWAWIPIAIAAAFSQTIRNATQRSLVARLGTLAATLVRFLYGLPFALVWLAFTQRFTQSQALLPPFDIAYVGWMLVGALAQLGATALMLKAMKQRNFIVGVAFSKTEVLQVGLFSTLFLQELPTVPAAVAMLIATAGVVLLAMPARTAVGRASWSSTAAWYGLGCGALFALSSVGYRGAALQLPGTSPWLIGAWAVLLAQTLQTVLLGAWLRLRAPGALTAVFAAWRPSLLAGMTGALASIGWLTAYAIRPAADVRTLGLVEVLFSYLVSRRLLDERLTHKELAGLLLVSAGVLVICAQF